MYYCVLNCREIIYTSGKFIETWGGGNDEDTLLLFLLSNDLLLTLLLLLVEVVKSILERKLYVEFFLNNLCVLMTNLLKDSKVGEYFEGND